MVSLGGLLVGSPPGRQEDFVRLTAAHDRLMSAGRAELITAEQGERAKAGSASGAAGSR